MTRSRLLLGVAAVLAGAAALFVALGATVNLVFLAAAVPFGLAAYFLWSDATGRLAARIRWHPVDDAERAREARRRQRAGARRQGPAPPGGWSRRAEGPGAGRGDGDAGRTAAEAGSAMDRRAALRTLGLSPGADQAAIRRAYRDRVKAVHPDAEGGDESAFREVTAAYERLRER